MLIVVYRCHRNKKKAIKAILLYVRVSYICCKWKGVAKANKGRCHGGDGGLPRQTKGVAMGETATCFGCWNVGLAVIGSFYCQCPPGKTGLLCHLNDACTLKP